MQAHRAQGTEDLYGSYMRAWQHMQDVARELFGAYGFDMIETPAIEQVDTFVHGIGESTDVVTGTEKPGIFVREGTLIATARDMLRLGDVTTEILETTGIPTPLGEVVILRARSAGNVQLAGPSITSQLREVSRMFFDLGADKSIIDGALGRKSLGARAVAEGVVLCTGASYHMSMERVVADTANIYRIMNLPKAETLPPEAEDGLEKCLKEHGEALAPGALTDSMVVPLLRSGFRMVVFSVVIMIVVLFFRKGIMGDRELFQKKPASTAKTAKKEARSK